MRKLKLLFMAAIAFIAIGGQTARAAAVDFLTGWTEVTSPLPTDNAELSQYYYVFVATEADLMLAQEYGTGKISDEANPQEDELTMVYRTPSNPLIAKKFVWMLSYDNTYLYGIRNLNNSTHYMQSRGSWPWRVQFAWETAQSKWTQWWLAYNDGKWTIQNKLSSEDGGGDSYYIGPWIARAFKDNNVVAGNKEGDNVGKFKIYRISRADFKAPTDVTSTYLTNPGFEYDDKTVNDANSKTEFVTNWKSVRIEYARYGIYNSSKESDGTYDKWGVSTASDGKYYLRIRSNLNDQTQTQNIQQNTAMNLPKGKFNISFDYKVARRTGTSLNLTVSAMASSTSKGSKVIAIPQVAANTSYFSSIGWTKGDFDFTLDNSTDIVIDIKCQTRGVTEGASVALLDNFVVNYYNINGPVLAALITQATSINSETGNLTSAIATAQAVYDGINNTPAYQSTIDAAITTLKEAITTSVAGISMSHGDDLSYLIANAGFEGLSAITANQATGTTIDYSSEGWLALSTTTSNSCGAVVAYRSDKTLNKVTAPSADNNGNSGKALGISIGWSATVAYQTAPITLPAGKYRMSVQGFNNNSEGSSFTSKFGFVPTAGGGNLSTKTSFTYNTWEKDELIFTLAEDTEGSFQIGGQAGNTYSTSHAILFLDNITLTYVTDLGLAKEAWDEAKAAAEAARDNSDYENVTGSEKTTLLAEIAKAEPTTTEAYETATTALQEATSAFTAAKGSYDALIAMRTVGATYTTVAWPRASAAKKTALDDAIAADPTDADDAVTKTNAIVTAYRQFVESNGLAEGIEVPMDYTNTYLSGADPDANTGWANGIGTDNRSQEQYTKGNGTQGGKYYDGGWSSSAAVNINMTRELTLPEGQYQLQITARGSNSLTSYTMSIGGETVNLPKDGADEATGTFGHGWSDKFVVFESDGTTPLTLAIVATSTDYYQWISFNRLRLVKLDGNESVTVTSAGYATYVSEYNLDFSASSIKAYKVKVSTKGIATLTKVDKVPADTPVLLYKAGGATENIPVIASADAVSDNDLVAGTGATVPTYETVSTTDDYTNMILNNGDYGIGFYYANDQIVATNRAYLHIATDLAPNRETGSRMVMVFADETTGISSHTPSLSPKGEGSVYTLSGQRVETPKKGLYIKNGKKVIIK